MGDVIEAPSLEDRLARIEDLLEQIVAQRTVKDYYTVSEVAEIVDRSEYQVRDWCKDGRMLAERQDAPYGGASRWKISHAELTRYRNHGPRPREARTGR